MRPAVVWLATLAAAVVAGFPVGFSRAFRRLSLGGRLSLSAGAAWFSISFWMTLLAAAGIPWNSLWVLVLACGGNALIALLLHGHPAVPLRGESASRLVQRLGLLLVTLAVLLAAAATTAGSVASADLFLFWGPKGQAFGTARTIDSRFLQDPAHEYLHASYPPLVTNLYALATMTAGRFSWVGAAATFALLVAVLALGLPGILQLSTTADRAAVAAAIVVSAVVLLGTEVNIGGNGEMPLLFFETLAMSMLISPAAKAASMQLMAGILLGGAACTKVEGLAYAVAAVTIFLVLRKAEVRTRAALLRLAGPTALALGVWFLWGASRRIFLGYQGYGEPLVLYPSAIGMVLVRVTRELWLVGYGLPFLAAAAMLVVREKPFRPALLPLGTAMALATFLLLVYLHQPTPAEWISWSAARVLSPLVPLLVLAGIAPCWPESAVQNRSLRVAGHGAERERSSND